MVNGNMLRPYRIPWQRPVPLPERLETARVVVRYWTAEDAAGMLAALNVDRASFLPWLPWTAFDNHSVAECVYKAEQWRRDRLKLECDDFVLGIFDRATGDVLGGTGYHRIDTMHATAEIGYWMRADRRGQGLMTEAVGAMLDWAFALPGEPGKGFSTGWGFHRVVVFCAGGNTASRRVCEKLGLRQEVKAVKARWVDRTTSGGVSGWDETLGWGVLASEWPEMAKLANG